MTPPDLETQLVRLEHQAQTVLYLSAVNLIANAITVLVAALAVLMW